MLAAAFAFALAVGVVASFVANELVPTFQDRRSLGEFAERPILGAVSTVIDEPLRIRRRRGLLIFCGGLASLFATFGALLAFALLIARAA